MLGLPWAEQGVAITEVLFIVTLVLCANHALKALVLSCLPLSYSS